MKKLTAVSIRTENRTSVHFVMLDTQKCIRGGKVDIKTRATHNEIDAMWRNHDAPLRRGETYTMA